MARSKWPTPTIGAKWPCKGVAERRLWRRRRMRTLQNVGGEQRAGHLGTGQLSALQVALDL